jgi:pyrophosphate--fructose-6-phosphate 1-phosphotransferase
MYIRKVALLTAGGLAPCLSSAVGALIERYTEVAPDIEIIGYKDGYAGLLTGDSITFTTEMREKAHLLHDLGGSPLGNSRVKLTNVKDAVKRGLVKEGEEPLDVAARQLTADGVDVLHTIGGDDTNLSARDLALHLRKQARELLVVGLPKTIDNDVFPIKMTLGAQSAADEGVRFARNIIAEHSSNPRMLIIHEVMGRKCGWLTAETARRYRRWLDQQEWAPGVGLDRDQWDVHGIYIPEMASDFDAEVERLRAIMDRNGNVNIFLSEGAGIDTIVAEKEAAGEEVQRDAYGHPRIDTLNPGQWFAKQLSERLGAQKSMVQKSGYFARSAPPNREDLRLIQAMCDYAIRCALAGKDGVVGHDNENGGRLRAIEFERIKGGKPFDIDEPWFGDLLDAIGQAKGPLAEGVGPHS